MTILRKGMIAFVLRMHGSYRLQAVRLDWGEREPMRTVVGYI